MATSEIQSLEEINYKSKIKIYLYPIITLFLFSLAFLNFYPIGEKLKSLIKTTLEGSGCNPDYDKLHIQWLMPKLVISDLVLPPGCLGQDAKKALKFSYVKVYFHFINFSPLGLPFKLETEMNSQPLSLYFVQGLGERLFRLKDQALVLSRLEPLFGENLKLAGNMTVDMALFMTNQNVLKNLSLKAQSKNLNFPSQNIQGFNTPNLNLNDLYIEASSQNTPQIQVSKFIIGDPDSPVRANFKGKIDLQQQAIRFSQVDLNGEVAFSESLKETLPLIDMMFQSFDQKDGFYQIRLGGTLGAIKPSSP